MKVALVSQHTNALTCNVLRVSDEFGLYRAETARILGLVCGDIGVLGSGQYAIDPQSHAGARALAFLQIHALPERKMKGDGVAMFHWLRKHHPAPGTTPLFCMVDAGDFTGVRQLLDRNADASAPC
jgi:hypothetical protein